MGIEPQDTSTIDGLDDSWPLGNDPTLDGDNHLRLIKRVLKLVFPGENGTGFAEPIVATETELNYLSGVTSNVQDQFYDLKSDLGDARRLLSAPDKTALLLYNQSNYPVPLGWKRVVITDNYMVVATSLQYAGTFQGVDDPIINVHTHSQSTIKITAANLPPHNHALVNTRVVNDEHGDRSNYNFIVQQAGFTEYTGTTGTGWGSNDPLQLPNTNSHKWEPKVAGIQVIERDITLDD
jgi:hypothetical protein